MTSQRARLRHGASPPKLTTKMRPRCYYMRFTEAEQAFKELKRRLAIASPHLTNLYFNAILGAPVRRFRYWHRQRWGARPTSS